MAFPTIPTVGAGRVLTGVQANTTATRTFPSLTGLTKNAGDLLIALVFGYEDSQTDAAWSSWGAGFTEFADSSGAGIGAFGAAYKISDGTETGTFSVTQAATITGHAAFILLSIPGAHQTTPPEWGSRANGTSSAANPGSFNPSGWDAEDTLWIAVAGSGETSTTGSYTGIASAPTNYSDYVDTGISGDVVGGGEAAVAFRQLNAASEDVGPFSVDTSNARNGALVIAVRPAPAVTPISANIGVTLSVAKTQQVNKVIGIAPTLTVEPTKKVYKGADIPVTLTVAETHARLLNRVADIGITFAVASTKQVNKVAALAVTHTVAAVKTVQKAAAIAVTHTVEALRLVQKPIAIAVTLSVSGLRLIQKIIGVAADFVVAVIVTPLTGAPPAYFIEEDIPVAFTVGVTMQVNYVGGFSTDWNEQTRALPPAGSIDKVG